ncbi:ARM repeat-containing protein [Dentipellis sp. KUC8613]|nr:ARM repeat-containing protein [Dentipellis sp. KUC8613]
MAAASKFQKKRPASTQSGPAAKKVHLETKSAHKKRARPVVEAEESDEDESEEEEKLMDEEAELYEAPEDGEDADDDMNVDKPAKEKDPNAARESHKVQKALHEQRRAAKPHSTLLTEAKQSWAFARQKNITKEERQKYVAELMKVISGKVQDIVFKHDASRIVQTVVKHGNQKQRDAVAVELKGRYKELAQNKYSKFLVTKLIRLCPAHRLSIILEFRGQVLRLLLHREASRAIADTYELYANAYERAMLLRDFYGKETALFSMTSGSSEDKEKARKGLKGVLEGANAETRKRVLNALRENLVTVFNNPDKGSIRHAIVHRALWEYLTEANESDDEAEAEKLRREMFETCQDVLAEMVHTKEGSRVVREFLVQGTAKDRKQIIKAIKPYIETMANDDEAQLVLFTALDVIDDTKLLAKSLLPSITSHASKLYSTSAGRRTLLYPIIQRDRRHFTPAILNSLAETDALREKTSKKDPEARAQEVRAAASPDLVSWIAREGAAVSRDTGGSLVVTEVMLEADGDKTEAMDALLAPLAEPYPSSDPTKPHSIDLPHTARMYKTLLQGGHFSQASRKVESAPRFDAAAFAAAFVRIVGRERTLQIARGGGAFVVAELLERVKEQGSGQTKAEVKKWVKELGKDKAEGEGVKGWNVLMEKVEALRA